MIVSFSSVILLPSAFPSAWRSSASSLITAPKWIPNLVYVLGFCVFWLLRAYPRLRLLEDGHETPPIIVGGIAGQAVPAQVGQAASQYLICPKLVHTLSYSFHRAGIY